MERNRSTAATVCHRCRMIPHAWLRSYRATAAVVGVGLAVLAPVLWMVLSRDDRFTGDMALIELRVRDVFSADPPIAGAYSRYGWAHPGPWQFYLFAVPYRLLGTDARALQLTTLGFNVAVAATIVWLAARRDRAAATAVGLALLALIAGIRPLSLAEGWNVTVTLLPFALTAVGCWRLLDGDRAALPITAAAAAFVASAHVGVGVVILPTVLVVLPIMVARLIRRSEGLRDPFVAATAAIAAIAAIPVLLDVADDPPGNAGRLLRWSLTNDEPNVGIADSLRMIGHASSLSFLRDPEQPGRFLLELGPLDAGLLPGFSIALLAVALIVTHRRGWRSERTWCLLIMGLWATGVVAATVITLPLGWWLVQWMQPIGWLTWSAIGLVAWRVMGDLTPARRQPDVERLAVVGAVVLGTIFVVDHARDAFAADDPNAEFVRPVDELTNAVVDTDGERPARLEFAGTSLLAETMLSGVVNRLDAMGHDVCVDASLAYKLGEHRVCPPGTGTRFVLRSEPRTLRPPAGTDEVIDVDPLTADERAEADELAARITDVLVHNGRADQIPILDSPLADVVLLDDPPPDLVAIRADVKRLAALRKVPGDRYVLYVGR